MYLASIYSLCNEWLIKPIQPQPPRNWIAQLLTVSVKAKLARGQLNRLCVKLAAFIQSLIISVLCVYVN